MTTEGVVFDDLWPMTIQQQNDLLSRNTVYVTEFLAADGHMYGGSIMAVSVECAQRALATRGLGERIIGTLGMVVPYVR